MCDNLEGHKVLKFLEQSAEWGQASNVPNAAG